MSNLAAAAYIVSDTTDTRIIEVPVRGLTVEDAVHACDRAITWGVSSGAPVHIEVQAAADMCDNCIGLFSCADAMGC